MFLLFLTILHHVSCFWPVFNCSSWTDSQGNPSGVPFLPELRNQEIFNKAFWIPPDNTVQIKLPDYFWSYVMDNQGNLYTLSRSTVYSKRIDEQRKVFELWPKIDILKEVGRQSNASSAHMVLLDKGVSQNFPILFGYLSWERRDPWNRIDINETMLFAIDITQGNLFWYSDIVKSDVSLTTHPSGNVIVSTNVWTAMVKPPSGSGLPFDSLLLWKIPNPTKKTVVSPSVSWTVYGVLEQKHREQWNDAYNYSVVGINSFSGEIETQIYIDAWKTVLSPLHPDTFFVTPSFVIFRGPEAPFGRFLSLNLGTGEIVTHPQNFKFRVWEKTAFLSQWCPDVFTTDHNAGLLYIPNYPKLACLDLQSGNVVWELEGYHSSDSAGVTLISTPTGIQYRLFTSLQGDSFHLYEMCNASGVYSMEKKKCECRGSWSGDHCTVINHECFIGSEPECKLSLLAVIIIGCVIGLILILCAICCICGLPCSKGEDENDKKEKETFLSQYGQNE